MAAVREAADTHQKFVDSCLIVLSTARQGCGAEQLIELLATGIGSSFRFWKFLEQV